jgi:hypothetical protein
MKISLNLIQSKETIWMNFIRNFLRQKKNKNSIILIFTMNKMKIIKNNMKKKRKNINNNKMKILPKIMKNMKNNIKTLKEMKMTGAIYIKQNSNKHIKNKRKKNNINKIFIINKVKFLIIMVKIMIFHLKIGRMKLNKMTLIMEILMMAIELYLNYIKIYTISII